MPCLVPGNAPDGGKWFFLHFYFLVAVPPGGGERFTFFLKVIGDVVAQLVERRPRYPMHSMRFESRQENKKNV